MERAQSGNAAAECDDRFTVVFGAVRGTGQVPRARRRMPADMDGYAQFAYMPYQLDESRRTSVQGEIPCPYWVSATLELDAESWRALIKDVKACLPALGVLGCDHTTIPADLLPAVASRREYSPAEWALYQAGMYYECTRLRSPDGEELLLTSDAANGAHLVGWPCPSPGDDARPWVSLDRDLVGRCVDGYTDRDIEDVLPELSAALGLRVVCVWDRYEDGGCDGGSEWLVVAGEDSEQLVDLPGRVWEILSDEESEYYQWENVDTRVNIATVGTVPSYRLDSLVQASPHNYVHKEGARELLREF